MKLGPLELLFKNKYNDAIEWFETESDQYPVELNQNTLQGWIQTGHFHDVEEAHLASPKQFAEKPINIQGPRTEAPNYTEMITQHRIDPDLLFSLD